MTTNIITSNPRFEPNTENSLLCRYGMNILNTPFVSDDNIELGLGEKYIVVEKLLEAHEFAKVNVLAGNITKRGFATNVCTEDRAWSLGANFNNTRNDISSICGERSAILASYNEALLRFSRRPNGKFDFKIKYLCMASNQSLEEITTMIAPCEDCLSWLNTNRYFNDDALVFSFERINNNLVVRASKMSDFLPYKDFKTSLMYDNNKEIFLSKNAKESLLKFDIKIEKLKEMLKIAIDNYYQQDIANISNQNIACCVLSNGEIFSSSKLDWTKRWHCEPLEFSCFKAIEKFGTKTRIQALCYFGDENSFSDAEFYNDGLVSIKSLGRIRQKYANADTLMVLNFENHVQVMTIGEYLPKKFEQGYKI